jgi:uncharacterized protein YlxW (UPF0749 family)
MSVFSSSINHRSFLLQISAVCFVLGLLLAAAVFTANQFTRAGGGPSNPALSFYGQGLQVLLTKVTQYESEITRLRQDKTELENRLAKQDGASATLNEELQDMKFFAGLTEVVGPGIQITLKDVSNTGPQTTGPNAPLNPNIYVHDEDIARTVNELKAAGAEAIAVNGQRIVSTSAIRCVGPVVHINSVPAAPPFVIQAIGDPEALYNGMNIQNGVLDEMRRFNPGMVRMEKMSKLLLPAFAGSTQPRHARPPGTTNSANRRSNKASK